MANTMGYQGQLFYGTKGSQAATQINHRVDCNYDLSVETGETTEAGDGSSIPLVTGEATAIDGKLTFSMRVKDNDAAIVALQAAAATGLAVALRFIRSTGKLGLDADCIISTKQGAPLKGEAAFDVTVERLSASDRTPLLNA